MNIFNYKNTNDSSDPHIDAPNKKRGSIKNQLIIWFITIAIVPLFILSSLTYQESSKGLTNTAIEQINHSAITKTDFINHWFNYRFRDIEVQSQSKNNVQFIEQLIDKYKQSNQPLKDYVKSYEWTKLSNQFANQIINLTRHYEYIYDVILIDQSENILFTISKENDLGTNLNTGKYSRTLFSKSVKQTIQSGKINFSGIERYQPSEKRLSGFLTAPFIDEDGTLIGVIALQLNLETVFSITANEHAKSLKHYFIDQNGLLQTPINSNLDTVLKQKINTKAFKLWNKKNHNKNEFLLKHEKENSSVSKYKGPDGNDVLGVHHEIKIGDVEWLLISEIDADYALKNSIKIAKTSSLIFFVTICIVIFIAILLSRKITSPISLLAKSALMIASNKTNKLISIDSNDEISFLAESFNKMLSLKELHERALEASHNAAKKYLAELELQKYALDQHAIIVTTNVRGDITSANKKFSDISGYTKDELVGSNHRILNSGYHDKDFFTQMYRTISKGHVWQSEICNRAKDGQIYWVDTTIVPIMDDNNKAVSYLAVRTEITQRKNAELALLKSETLARNIFESVADGIVTVNQEGIIISSNPAAIKMFGHTQEELINKNITLLIPESLRKKHSQGMHLINQNNNLDFLNKAVQVTGLKKDGFQFPLELSVSKVNNGENVFYTAMVRDVSQRVQEETKKKRLLLSSNMKLKISKTLSRHASLKARFEAGLTILLDMELFLDTSKGGVFIPENNEGHFSLLSSIGDFSSTLNQDTIQCEEVFENREIVIFNHSDSSQNNLLSSSAVDNSLSNCVYYIPLANQGLSLSHILGVLVLYTKNPNSNTETLIMLQEISDLFAASIMQNNVQNMFKKATDIAEQNSQLKSDFLASMSHEIRTPMNGVLGMLSLLLNSELTKDQKHKANLAKSSAESLLTLINDILDFSKIEAGKIDLEILDFNLRDMLGEFTESIAFKGQNEGLEIILDIVGIEQSRVKGDPGRIRQILTNLVGNSIKFTHQGEIIIRATLTPEKEDQLRFDCSIIDTGIGIPKVNIPLLFDKFSQVDSSTTRKYGGTGLGLSISKKLCELMGGSIEVISEIDKGSSFNFSIYLNGSENSKPVGPRENVSGLRILIVDDNSSTRSSLRRQLEHWGVTVAEAENAEKAIRYCQSEVHFDGALFDIKTPGMGGVELALNIRKNKKLNHIKLFMMTTISDPGDPSYYNKIGFTDYFPKPITTISLLKMLSEIINLDNIFASQSPLLEAENNFQEEIPEPKLKLTKVSSTSDKPMTYRLMLVEDNPINQQVALGLLEQLGLSADITANGLEALNLLKLSSIDNQYDAILMDCQMPEMDGYETTKNIRRGTAGEHYKMIPIIAMTANSMQGDKRKCIDAGMNDYIPKPIEADVLAKKLSHWLQYTRPEKTVKDQAVLNKLNQSTIKVWDKDAAIKRLMGNQKLLATLVEMFVEDIPKKLSELHKMVTDNDISGVRHTAHTIKGIAANLSGMTLQNATEELEVAAINNNSSNFKQFVSNIEKEINKFSEVLTLYLQDKTDNKTSKNKKNSTSVNVEEISLQTNSIYSKVLANDYIDPEEISDLKNKIFQADAIEILSDLQNQIKTFDNDNAVITLKNFSNLMNFKLNEI